MIKTLHFLSDEPTTQYRPKNMFWLLVTFIQKNSKQIDTIVYNFSESGHGKGACDGVEALTKRSADAAVANRQDISSLNKLFSFLKNSSANCWFDIVLAEKITKFDEAAKAKAKQKTKVIFFNLSVYRRSHLEFFSF